MLRSLGIVLAVWFGCNLLYGAVELVLFGHQPHEVNFAMFLGFQAVVLLLGVTVARRKLQEGASAHSTGDARDGQ